jgi:uncharacterized membrane protein YgcG
MLFPLCFYARKVCVFCRSTVRKVEIINKRSIHIAYTNKSLIAAVISLQRMDGSLIRLMVRANRKKKGGGGGGGGGGGDAPRTRFLQLSGMCSYL